MLHLIFNITALLLTKVAEDFGEYPFQCVVAHCTTSGTFGVLHCYITVIAKVECGAIEMATVLGGILVAVAQFLHVILGAQHACDDYLVERNTLDGERIEEIGRASCRERV